MFKLIKRIRNEIIVDLSSPGNFFVYALVVIMFYISGDYAFAADLLIAAASVSIATYLIKLLYYKPRPDNTRGEKFKDVFIKLNESSFPSLHTARAAVLGVAFLSRYGTIAALVFAIVIIAGVSISRIELKRHYFSDIIGGIILGVFTGYLVFLA